MCTSIELCYIEARSTSASYLPVASRYLECLLSSAAKYLLLLTLIQESGSEEITLHDDDPDAMFALLRFLYDLPYISGENTKWSRNTLQPHASVYVVADKYQIKALQSETCENMRRLLTSPSFLAVMATPNDDHVGELKNGSDFVSALQKIITGTTEHDTQARKLMIKFVIQNIEALRKAEEFMALLRETPSLGAGLIGHKDFECQARGSWRCENIDCPCSPEGTPICMGCGSQFTPEIVHKKRYDGWWSCSNPVCVTLDAPRCKECKTRVLWQPDNEPLRAQPWKFDFGSNPPALIRG